MIHKENKNKNKNKKQERSKITIPIMNILMMPSAAVIIRCHHTSRPMIPTPNNVHLKMYLHVS